MRAKPVAAALLVTKVVTPCTSAPLVLTSMSPSNCVRLPIPAVVFVSPSVMFDSTSMPALPVSVVSSSWVPCPTSSVFCPFVLLTVTRLVLNVGAVTSSRDAGVSVPSVSFRSRKPPEMFSKFTPAGTDRPGDAAVPSMFSSNVLVGYGSVRMKGSGGVQVRTPALSTQAARAGRGASSAATALATQRVAAPSPAFIARVFCIAAYLKRGSAPDCDLRPILVATL